MRARIWFDVTRQLGVDPDAILSEETRALIDATTERLLDARFMLGGLGDY